MMSILGIFARPILFLGIKFIVSFGSEHTNRGDPWVVEVPGPIVIIAILFVPPIGGPILSPMGFALSSTVVHNAKGAPLSIPVFDAMEDTYLLLS